MVNKFSSPYNTTTNGENFSVAGARYTSIGPDAGFCWRRPRRHYFTFFTGAHFLGSWAIYRSYSLSCSHLLWRIAARRQKFQDWGEQRKNFPQFLFPDEKASLPCVVFFSTSISVKSFTRAAQNQRGAIKKRKKSTWLNGTRKKRNRKQYIPWVFCYNYSRNWGWEGMCQFV